MHTPGRSARVFGCQQQPASRRLAAAACLAHAHYDGGLTPATSAPGLGSRLPRRHRDWAHSLRTSAPGLGSPPPTSAPGMGSPLHVCTGTGLTAATSAPGLGSPPASLSGRLALDARRSARPRWPTPQSVWSAWLRIAVSRARAATLTALANTALLAGARGVENRPEPFDLEGRQRIIVSSAAPHCSQAH